MTGLQRITQVFGIAFVAVAVLGFLTTGLSMQGEMERAGRILGIFPVNLPHNLAHLAFGVWGIVAARSWRASKTYCQVSGIAYLLLAALGYVSPDLGGHLPLGGADIFLHVTLGAILAVVGFTADEPETAHTPSAAGAR
jgi:hypothetical protein